jgi:hypothetical protein
MQLGMFYYVFSPHTYSAKKNTLTKNIRQVEIKLDQQYTANGHHKLYNMCQNGVLQNDNLSEWETYEKYTSIYYIGSKLIVICF